MNIRIEQMKKKLKASKNLENDKLIVKKILDADKAAIDKINKDIEKIRLTLADDYIPVPLYRMISQPSKKEKLNLDIKENTMLIKVKNLTYTKSNPLIMLAIRGDDININKEIKGKNPEDINEELFLQGYNHLLILLLLKIALTYLLILPLYPFLDRLSFP